MRHFYGSFGDICGGGGDYKGHVDRSIKKMIVTETKPEDPIEKVIRETVLSKHGVKGVTAVKTVCDRSLYYIQHGQLFKLEISGMEAMQNSGDVSLCLLVEDKMRKAKAIG